MFDCFYLLVDRVKQVLDGITNKIFFVPHNYNCSNCYTLPDIYLIPFPYVDFDALITQIDAGVFLLLIYIK